MSILVDRVNPLVVKELRQGVRSRVLWTAFGLLLVACLGISFAAYLGSLSTVELNGSAYFSMFYTCACFIYLFVIPAMAYQSLLHEQEAETWPLLTMTGMGARRIIRGKVSSALVLAGLYSSVIFPFLLFAYYLNGIELGTILTAVGAAVVLMVFLTFSSVCWATFGHNRVLRNALRTLFILGTLWLAGVFVALGFDLFRRGRFWDADTLVPLSATLWSMFSFAVLFYETAVARLSLESEDCSGGPRRALLLQLVGSWIGAFLFWRHQHREVDVPVILNAWLMAHLTVTGLLMATDADGIPRGLHRRLRGWDLLFPGAVRGYRFILLLLGVTVGGAILLITFSPTVLRGPPVETVMACAGYAASYLGVSLLCGHYLPLGNVTPRLRSRIAFVVVTFMGSLLPILVDELVPPLAPWVGVISPISGVKAFFGHRYEGFTHELLGALVAVGVLLTLWANHVLARRDRQARVSNAAVQG